jgi:hypothetical protein
MHGTAVYELVDIAMPLSALDEYVDISVDICAAYMHSQV